METSVHLTDAAVLLQIQAQLFPHRQILGLGGLPQGVLERAVLAEMFTE